MCLQKVTKLGQGKKSDAMPRNQSIVFESSYTVPFLCSA